MIRSISKRVTNLLQALTSDVPVIGPFLSNSNTQPPSLGRWGRGPGRTIDYYDNCFSTIIAVDKEHYDKIMAKIK